MSSSSISLPDARDAKSSVEGSKHTPGPWEWGPCLDASGTYVSSLDICLPSEPGDIGVGVLASVWGSEANACLMAAAPELLEALRALDAVLGSTPMPDCAAMNRLIAASGKARAAIAKATHDASPAAAASPAAGSVQTREEPHD